ncbi:NAD(P)/FAD-dependent oxidoreductase [Mucilaginibacter koreensis]
MEHAEIIVIGAGAAGLMAAFTLAKAGKRVIVLEARNRTGGRIHTLNHTLFFKNAELGAEFIHGDLPLTLSLTKEAGLKIEPAGGEMWRVKNGTFSKDEAQDDYWEELLQKLNELKEDKPLSQFLAEHFADTRYDAFKTSIRQYVAGYDTGDPDKISSFALREEWQNEDEGAQHRLSAGYCSLINYLVQSCREAGATIYLNEPVKQLNWQANHAEVVTDSGDRFKGNQIIVAIPLGVLQQPETAAAAINFTPAIAEQTEAWQLMGFGDIIKILLQFEDKFWETYSTGQMQAGDLENMGFLFSEETIPTWWTQAPRHTPLLTGWLGGLPAGKVKHYTHEQLLEEALQSLSHIFNYTPADIKAKLVAWHVANWSADLYTCGSYAYDTVPAHASRQLLNKGVQQTIYFAGDYLYEGPAMGTVEAALQSGKFTAEQILSK